jgi:CarboxypepD_reg-like domain/Bacterial Ig-like domain (group 2)
MRRVLSGLLSAIALSFGWWACGGAGNTPVSPSTATTTPATPTVTSVVVTGSTPNVGSSAQFAANATMSNGTSQIVTSLATWQSSAASVATVNSAGVVAALAAGETDITATYQTTSGKMHLVLVPATVTLSGTVTEATSGALLAGIVVAGGGRSTTTDANGRYSMTVSAGAIGLVASGSGYVTTEKILTVTADTRVDFVLARVATPTPTPTPTPAPGPITAPGLPSRTAVGNVFKCSLGDIVHPASCVNDMFGNATAICGDGARSCSSSNSGTCSSHSGVYCFVCPGPLCP